MTTTAAAIQIWNRQTQQYDIEKIAGENGIRWLYGSGGGAIARRIPGLKKGFSMAFGWSQDTRRSSRKIPEFIQQFQIPMHEFQEENYESFNQFFIRPFKPGIRPFVTDPTILPAFAEGRYYALSKVDRSAAVQIKGIRCHPSDLLRETSLAKRFEGGPVLIARLCPTDYHRFHFPDGGQIESYFKIHGNYDSVNPIALAVSPSILIRNERQISILRTENFGLLAMIEVGALCVGKIHQHLASGAFFKRGEEKGYFLFGGSTVVLIGEPGKWTPDEDLVEQTKLGFETKIHLGERLAKRLNIG